MVYAAFRRSNSFKMGRQLQIVVRLLCDKNGKPPIQHSSIEKSVEASTKDEFPEAPTTCCMSGCPNCVWLEYAEKLSAYFKDGGDRATKELNEKIDDDNIKAFIMHEWRMRQKKS